jgi:rhomboid family GlyGly-CTERM serine protease
MGLHQDEPGRTGPASWALPVAIVVLCAGLAAAGDAVRDALAWDRQAIAAGEAWRLVSAHFVHLGWSHYLLDSTGLVLVWFLVGAYLGPLRWLLVLGVVIAGIDAGFWMLEPQLAWYVGLSGVVHGLLAAGLVAGLTRDRHELWILAVLLSAKLAWEQFVGPLPGSEASTGGTVITAAHLYGALAGLAAGGWFRIRVRTPASI